MIKAITLLVLLMNPTASASSTGRSEDTVTERALNTCKPHANTITTTTTAQEVPIDITSTFVLSPHTTK